jgi:hypothetical protein
VLIHGAVALYIFFSIAEDTNPAKE